MPDNANAPDYILVLEKIEQAKAVLKDIGLPAAQQNERSALTLLALLYLKVNIPWSLATNPLLGITPIMEFIANYYNKTYAPNSRETIRRQTIHQFLEAGFVISNPDQPSRPTNSPKTVYQIESSALKLFRKYQTNYWSQNLITYLTTVETLEPARE
jgi:hypothetical protein